MDLKPVNTYFVMTSDGKAECNASIVTEESLQVRYFNGTPIGSTFPRTEVVLSVSANPDIICVGSLDLVSQRLKESLEAEDIKAEFLPVEVTAGRKKTRKLYYEFNLLAALACLDHSRSRFTEFSAEAGGGVFRIHELHIDQEQAGSSIAFVLKEKPMVIVRSDIATRLQKAAFSGLLLIPLPSGPF